MNNNQTKIFISAGEQSGDLHAGELVKYLIKLNPDRNFVFTGLGGNELKNAGVKLLYHVSELAVVGLTDVIKKYGFFRKVLNKSIEQVKSNNPDCVILVDYPGFNLRFAEKLRRFYANKIIYYISPQLWAWHEKRVIKIKKFIDKVLVVFPFEVDFYKKHNVDAEFVGHPLTRRIGYFLMHNQKRKKIYGESKVLAILPGSRKDEIKLHLPVLLKTAEQIMKEFDVKITVSIAPSVDENIFTEYIKLYKNIDFTKETAYSLINNSDLVITKAGTTTVECALIGTPFISIYKTHIINYYLLKPFVKVNSLCMVNILAGKSIVKELIQNDFNVINLLAECRKILTDTQYYYNISESLKLIGEILGMQNASENAAKVISSYLN